MIGTPCKGCGLDKLWQTDEGFCDECRWEQNERSDDVPIAEASTNGRRTGWSARELLAETFPDPRFAVDGLLPEGLAFMAGAPKLGKSWLALGMSIAVASGGYALGSIPVEQGDAKYLALEDSPRRLQSRVRTLLAGDPAPDALFVETAWPRLDEGGADRLEEWLDAHSNARAVWIDVWPRIRPRVRNRNDMYQADYDGAALLQSVAIRRGIAIVALFHTRKAEAEDFVETVQGTFGTAAAADTIVVVKRSRGKADATLHVTGRDVEERELALRFEPGIGTWTLIGDAAEHALGETRHQLLEAVRAHGSLTPKQAAEVTEIEYPLAKVTLWRMAQDGQLQADGGRYTLSPAVTGVTVLPGTEGHEGQGLQSYRGNSGPEEADR